MQQLNEFTYSSRFSDSIPIVGSAFTKNQQDAIPLSFGFPAPETFPIQTIIDATTYSLMTDGDRALQYTGGDGKKKIAQWIVDRSKLRSIETSSENVLVTTGSMQAIDLAVRTLTDENDEVWIEAPTFFGAVRIFQLAGVCLRAFPVDQNGVDVDAIEKALIDATNNHQPLPKMIYVMPNYHNPTGVNLSLERRKKLAALAYRYNFFILEDDAYVDLNFSNIYVPAIYHYAPERVIYLSTFSKLIAPSIRMGWAIGNDSVIQKMHLLKVDGTTSAFVQEIVANVLEKMNLETHITSITQLYRERCEAMISAVLNYFGDEVTFVVPKGGFFLWLTFPFGVNTSHLVQACVDKGVNFIAGEYFYEGCLEFNHLRLCFTFCDEKKIDEGIKRIAEVYFANKNLQLFQEAE